MRWDTKTSAASRCRVRFLRTTCVRDAKDMAERFGIAFDIVSITPGYEEMVRTLAPVFEDRKPDVAEENIQARLRGLP